MVLIDRLEHVTGLLRGQLRFRDAIGEALGARVHYNGSTGFRKSVWEHGRGRSESDCSLGVHGARGLQSTCPRFRLGILALGLDRLHGRLLQRHAAHHLLHFSRISHLLSSQRV